MARVKLGTRHQITLPSDTIERLGITAGDELELIEAAKVLVLVPRKHIPRDQRWYYTDQWQQMMIEAFEALKKGEVIGPFSTVEEAIQALKATKV